VFLGSKARAGELVAATASLADASVPTGGVSGKSAIDGIFCVSEIAYFRSLSIASSSRTLAI
jgi:hypothetical protein